MRSCQIGVSSTSEAEGISFAENFRNLDFPDDERAVHVEYEQLCVIRGAYKLVADRSTLDPNALFNLELAPFEMTDLVTESSYKDKVSQLIGELERLKHNLGE
jgi:hypothetical protein